MNWTDATLLILAGLFTGFLNTVAGGGSLITLPLMIFMGLPGTVANASNRVALFISSIFAVRGFKSKGVSAFPYSYWVSISACIGAALGAYLAVDIRNDLFNRVLAVIMVMIMVLTVFKPFRKIKDHETFSKRRNLVSIIIFFFVGIYGGFIQAGVGFLIIATLTGIHGMNMAKTNSVKSFVIVCYTVIALIIFIVEDKVRWEYGLILGAGNSCGAWIASRWSVGRDDKWIRLILIIAVCALAVKLWFFE